MNRVNPLLLVGGLAACAPDAADSGPEVDSGIDALDLRLTEADYDPADVQLWGPDVVIEPGEDIMYCIAGTWSGEDLGIHTLTTWQNKFGHHLQFYELTLSTIEWPDDEVHACGVGTDFDMTDTLPVGVPTAVWLGGEQTIDNPLAEGMAFSFDGGRRYLLQAHYVNTGDQAVRSKDVVTFATLDPETEVTTWAAPVILNNGNVDIPAASEGHMRFDCAMDQEMSVLFANGHMHEWGTSFTMTQTRADVARVLNTVPTWQAYYRDAPPTDYFDPGELSLAPGDTLTTECNWMNTTDESIAFPHEMCDGVMIGYPLKTTWICDSDEGMLP